MSLIVRQLKQYSTNRSAAFAGTRCFLLTLPVYLQHKYYEIASGSNLADYSFYVTPHLDAPAIKRVIKRNGIDSFIKSNDQCCVRWDSASTIEMDWSNPPKEPMMAVLVQVVKGQPDFTSPALFMYVPEAEAKPRMKRRMKPLPKGTGPIPYRL